jgi:NADH:ubiquinone oxidoreductase subunit 6 (subunit J)
MITISMISFLAGAALGQRFKVMVLMPAIAIVLVLAVGTGVAHAQTAWSTVLMAATAATCLQIGYLIGIFTHYVLVAVLSRRSSPLTSPETPARHAAR